jgi:hypothetical protein
MWKRRTPHHTKRCSEEFRRRDDEFRRHHPNDYTIYNGFQ